MLLQHSFKVYHPTQAGDLYNPHAIKRFSLTLDSKSKAARLLECSRSLIVLPTTICLSFPSVSYGSRYSVHFTFLATEAQRFRKTLSAALKAQKPQAPA